MLIKVRTFSKVMVAIALGLLLLNPMATASATTSTLTLTPTSMVTIQGSSVGNVASLSVQNQAGTADTPSKYVVFKTPGMNYIGYRVFSVPGSIPASTVDSMAISVNYKGPVKTVQTWSWSLYDWVSSTWVKVGDNAGAKAYIWKTLHFSVPSDAGRYINGATHQVWLQLASNKPTYNAKLDYEGITLTYGPECSDPLGCVLVRSGQPIHIAYLLNSPSLESLNGAILAKEQAATILGHTIQFDGFSRADCNAAQEQADAATVLADGSVVAILGTSCSAEARAIIPAVTGAGLSMVSPSNTAPDLTQPGTAGYLRVSWSDARQGELAAQYAASLSGVTTAATIDTGDGYSQSLVQAFHDSFVAGGVNSITMQKTITADQVDIRPELEDIAISASGSAPNVVYFPVVMPAGGYIINQARAISNLKISDGVYLMGSDGLSDPMVVLSTGTDLEGFLVTAINNPLPAAGYSTFKTDYNTRFLQDPAWNQYAPFGYDAFKVIKAAIETSGVATDEGGGVHLINLHLLREALYATSALPGSTGSITCDLHGDCGAANVLAVYKYTAGEDAPTKVFP